MTLFAGKDIVDVAIIGEGLPDFLQRCIRPEQDYPL